MEYPEHDEIPTDRMAFAALVLALAGLALPVIPSVSALVVAPLAKRRISQSNGKVTGIGLATAAQLLAVFGLAGMLIFALSVWLFML